MAGIGFIRRCGGVVDGRAAATAAGACLVDGGHKAGFIGCLQIGHAADILADLFKLAADCFGQLNHALAKCYHFYS